MIHSPQRCSTILVLIRDIDINSTRARRFQKMKLNFRPPLYTGTGRSSFTIIRPAVIDMWPMEVGSGSLWVKRRQKNLKKAPLVFLKGISMEAFSLFQNFRSMVPYFFFFGTLNPQKKKVLICRSNENYCPLGSWVKGRKLRRLNRWSRVSFNYLP